MNITVVGAGKTGRGFLGRLLHESGQAVRFIDANRELIDDLRTAKAIGIRYFGNTRASTDIPVGAAYHTSEAQGITMVATSDVVFVAVGASNLTNVAKYIAGALTQRAESAKNPLVIITAENAINPAAKLQNEISKALDTHEPFFVTESAIFCSTIEAESSPIDIQSEDFDVLPFDPSRVPFQFPELPFLQPEENFPLLLTRKIYTYNCASAAIAYLGALKGYRLYGEAANDEDVATVLSALYGDVNSVLCKKYHIDPADQHAFAERSRVKFQNTEILDSVERNARDASRKLAKDERLIGPMQLSVKQGLLSRALAIVIAAAIHYSYTHQESPLKQLLDEGGIPRVLGDISGITNQPDVVGLVVSCYRHIADEVPLDQIIATFLDQDGGNA